MKDKINKFLFFIVSVVWALLFGTLGFYMVDWSLTANNSFWAGGAFWFGMLSFVVALYGSLIIFKGSPNETKKS
tara:strand:+ start:177 stop:398 length:222 start_codon:yes stop_codon:yes gene_type:complete